MKLFTFIFLISTMTHACPLPLTYRGENLCVELQWQKADSFKNGEYKASSTDSPYLNPTGSKPAQWLYSRATLTVWKADDAQKTPLDVSGLRFLPFMVMKNGHHHSWNHALEFDTQKSIYTLWQTPFQQMEGCWQIRWIDSAKPHENFVLLKEIQFLNTKAQSYSDLCQ